MNEGSILLVCVCTYVCVRHAYECRGDVTLECRGVTLAGSGIRNVTYAYRAYAWRAELAVGALCLEDLGRRRVELKVWRRTERGLQVEEEESVVFSNVEVRVKRAGPSGLGELEVAECIARILSGPFEREDGASVHLATTENGIHA